MYQKSMVVECF